MFASQLLSTQTIARLSAMRRDGSARRAEATGDTGRAGEREPVKIGRLEPLLGYALRSAQIRVFQDFANEMKELGLTPGQLGTLFLIEANRGLSQSELGAALGIHRSSVVPLIDRL